MAGPKKPRQQPVEATALPSCVTLKISPEKLRALNLPETSTRHTSTTDRASVQNEDDATVNNTEEDEGEISMLETDSDMDVGARSSTNNSNASTSRGLSRANDRTRLNTGSSRLHSPAHRGQRRTKSILKHGPIPATTSTKRQTRGRGTATATAAAASRSVTLEPEPNVLEVDSSPCVGSSEENHTPGDSDEVNSSPSASSNEKMADTPEKQSLPPPQRPSLKLKLSKPVLPQVEANQTVQTPAPTSAARTPSIKLKFGGTPTPALAKASKKEKEGDTITVTPASSTKKRKRPYNPNESEDEIARPAPKPPARAPKITLKTDPKIDPSPQTQTPVHPTSLKFRAKGKPPKRPLGVGYDSELEEREADPVIHEGFILRMQPGPDCDYLRKAIEENKVGVARALGGADVRMRMLDTWGRRGIMIIRGNQYATTLVDLPCIVEGMKSWDKKGWIKSVDICQMLLVLGRCNTDEEARNYPLPEDVDPKNYQYAHGITAPMKWVRKRRFARTKRARVDDIEAVERRVKALLEADKAAVSTKYQLLDHDPRLDEERYSSGLEGDDDEDAEGEYDDDYDADGYFDSRNGQHAGALETPMLTETPVEDIGQDEVDEFERMFAGDDDEVAPTADHNPAPPARDTLHIPEAGDSSFNVTSTSASPSATVAHTPASAAEAEAEASSDEDEDDDVGNDEDEDLDDAEKEGDENLQQVKDRIQDMQQKIAEQTEVLKQTQNAILKKKLARKIQDLKDDVAMMKKNAGLGGDEDDD